MDVLIAEVSLATHEALQSLGAFVGAVDNADKSLDKLGLVVKLQEENIAKLGKALKQAEDQFKATGTEADRLKMEELRKATKDAAELADKSTKEFKQFEEQLKTAGRQAQRTGADTTKANKDIASSSKEVGDRAEEAGRKGAEAGDKMSRKTKEAASVIDKLGDSLLGIGSALVSLQTAVRVMDELRQHTQAVIDARIRLGDLKVGLDERVQSIVDNAELGRFGTEGQARARGLVKELQLRAPGVKAEVAAEILAKAQATDYTIANPDKPELDSKLPGFDIAVQVAKFAGPNRLKPETAGKLLNLAKAAGVTDSGQMELFLAKVQGAFNRISITDPEAGMDAAVTASLGRMSQGVSVEQAMASVAAAATSETNASKAAVNVEQFTRVAVGTDPIRRMRLARLAQKQGVISSEQLEAERQRVAPEVGTSDDAIRRTEMEMERDADTQLRASRDLADYQADQASKEASHRYAMEAAAKQRDPRKRAEAERKEGSEWDRTQREAKQRIEDSETKEKEFEGRMSERRANIDDMRKKDAEKITAVALDRLYSSLSLQAKEELIWSATAAMTPQEIAIFASQIAEGDISQQIIKQLSPAARQARANVLAGKPDLEKFRAGQTGFAQGSVAQKLITDISAEQAGVSATPIGADYSNNITTLAKADIAILESKGEGRVGQAAAMRLDFGNIDIASNAGTMEALRGRRAMMIAWDQFNRFVSTMDSRTYNKHKANIDNEMNLFKESWGYVFSAEGVGRSGTDIESRSQSAIMRIGAFMQRLQIDARKSGETPGVLGAQGLDLPANKGVPVEVGSIGSSGTSGGPLGSAGEPLALSGGGGSTYNVSVGTLISQGGDSLDLPGPLGDIDLRLG